MRKTILIVLVSVALAQCPGGTFLQNGQQVNCTCTDVYTKRFRTTNATSRVNSTINFQSSVGTDAQQKNLIINITFVDNKTDPTTNLDNPFSCIKPVFNKYGRNFAGTPIVQTPTIVSTFNDTTGLRIWSYTISQANFSTELDAQGGSQTSKKYAGFFSIDFSEVKVSFNYSFDIYVNLQTNKTETNFFKLGIVEKAVCISDNQNCALLQFCNTPDCATPTSVINLVVYQNYWLLLSIKNKGFTQYLLKNPTLLLIAESQLFRQYSPPASQVNVQSGKTIISCTADFAYQNVEIVVSAELFFPEQGRRLAQITNTTSLTMTATSSSIDCIKYAQISACVQCADQCKINNGFASSNCPECKEQTNSSIISISILVIMMIFMC